MLGEAVTQISLPEQIAENILSALTADQEKINEERQTEFKSASERLQELEGLKRLAYEDRYFGVIDDAQWRSMGVKWGTEELQLRVRLESTSRTALSSKLDSVRRTFELAQVTKNKRGYSLKPRKGKNRESCTFELLD